MSVTLILIATLCLALSGLPALLLPARSKVGALLGAFLNVLACLVAAVGILVFLQAPATDNELNCEWALPMGHFDCGLDPLSILFLIPIFLIAALGSIYSLDYWPPKR